jgi:hypothetical protein
MKKRQRVARLTVREAKVVKQGAESHQRLLDTAARADVCEAIRQGLDDIAHGRTRPARQVLDEFRQRHRMQR